MERKQRNVLTALVAMVLALAATAGAAESADAPRMSKEELKARLGDGDVLVLDLRRGDDWTSSDHRIPGAIRQEDKPYLAWAIQYPKDQTMVLYCA